MGGVQGLVGEVEFQRAVFGDQALELGGEDAEAVVDGGVEVLDAGAVGDGPLGGVAGLPGQG